MEKFVVKRVCEYLDQLRQELSVPPEPVVRMPDGTKVPASVYIDQQLRQKSSRLNSQRDQIRSTNFYSIKTEHKIQIGSFNCRADVVLLKLPFFETHPNRLIVVVECKAVGKTGDGIEQLQSYLCATDTRFGIFAASLSADKWQYYENYGRNDFRLISQQKFEAQIGSQENAEADKEKEAKRRIEQAIELHSQRVEQRLTNQYKDKEVNLQADFKKKESDLQANRQKLLNEKRSERFWSGFWAGIFTVIVFVVIVVIISGG